MDYVGHNGHYGWKTALCGGILVPLENLGWAFAQS